MELTLWELQEWLACPKKYEISRLWGKEDKYRYYRHSAVRRMCRMLQDKAPLAEIRKWIVEFMKEHYREEWFPLLWQKDEAVRNDSACLFRFLGCFPYDRALEIKCHQKIWVDVQKELKGRFVEGFWLIVDLLIHYRDNTWEAVMLHWKFGKKYSSNKDRRYSQMMTSPELLGMLEHYSDLPGLRVSMVQLTENKQQDDGESSYYNRVSFCAEELKLTEDQIQGNIAEGLRRIEAPKCRECSRWHICQVRDKVLSDRTVQGVEDASPAGNDVFAGQDAVRFMDGPVRVIAGPGSGKTHITVSRAKELIRNGVPAGRILMVTFTREAAKELMQRMTGNQVPEISTLHSLACRILYQNGGWNGKKIPVGTLEKKDLLLRVLKYMPRLEGMSYDGITRRYGLLGTLLRYFEEIETSGEAAFRSQHMGKDLDGILEVKTHYDRGFRQSGYITYKEQITEAVGLLASDPGVLAAQREKYQYLLIDEAQDLDREQAQLVKLLAGSYPNLMIVGDDDQAIFGFRGSDSSFMLQFQDSFPKAMEIVLGENNRCSEEIVQVSAELIARGRHRIVKRLHSSAGSSGLPCVHIEQFLLSGIVQLLQDIRQNLQCEWGDIAVLAKNNKELETMCDILEKHNKGKTLDQVIPYRRPKYYLIHTAAFLGLSDLLVLYVKGMDQDRALYRLLYNLGVESVVKQDTNLSLYQDLAKRQEVYPEIGDAAYYFTSADDPIMLHTFSRIARARDFMNLGLERGIPLAMEALYSGTGLEYLPVLETVLDLLKEKGIVTPEDACRYFENMEFLQDDTRVHYPEKGNQVHFFTAHESKGKEFPAVIIYGIDMFECDPEEGRRLLYVAMTRAEKCLVTTEAVKGKSNYLRDFMDKIKIYGGKRYVGC